MDAPSVGRRLRAGDDGEGRDVSVGGGGVSLHRGSHRRRLARWPPHRRSGKVRACIMISIYASMFTMYTNTIRSLIQLWHWILTFSLTGRHLCLWITCCASSRASSSYFVNSLDLWRCWWLAGSRLVSIQVKINIFTESLLTGTVYCHLMVPLLMLHILASPWLVITVLCTVVLHGIMWYPITWSIFFISCTTRKILAEIVSIICTLVKRIVRLHLLYKLSWNAVVLIYVRIYK